MICQIPVHIFLHIRNLRRKAFQSWSCTIADSKGIFLIPAIIQTDKYFGTSPAAFHCIVKAAKSFTVHGDKFWKTDIPYIIISACTVYFISQDPVTYITVIFSKLLSQICKHCFHSLSSCAVICVPSIISCFCIRTVSRNKALRTGIPVNTDLCSHLDSLCITLLNKIYISVQTIKMICFPIIFICFHTTVFSHQVWNI